jgi:hypothetical protein
MIHKKICRTPRHNDMSSRIFAEGIREALEEARKKGRLPPCSDYAIFP